MASPTPPTDAPPRTALVVADLMFAARLRQALERMGWGVEMTSSAAAVERLRQSPPALVLLELGPPGRIDVIRDAIAGGVSAPILAFGSHKQRGMLHEAREAGAALVVSNGTLVARFEQMVAKACGGAGADEDRLLIDEDDDPPAV